MAVSYRIIAVLALVAALVAAATFLRPGTFVDGTYEAFSQATDKGFSWARVTMLRNKISAVELKTFDGRAQEKDLATYPWPETRQATEILPQRFVDRNTWDVDIVAKATSTSNQYKEAVRFALEKARRRPSIQTSHFNGTFMGRSEAGPYGYGLVWATINNDQVTNVLIREVVAATDTFKDFETYWPPAGAARDTMTTRLQTTVANVPNVDIVAGVTSSSQQWKQAAIEAVGKARIR
jgi:uncharacterized protein with FMN-binding domain